MTTPIFQKHKTLLPALALLSCALMLTGCGTRLDQAARQSARGQGDGVLLAGSAGGTNGTGGTGGAAGDGTTGSLTQVPGASGGPVAAGRTGTVGGTGATRGTAGTAGSAGTAGTAGTAPGGTNGGAAAGTPLVVGVVGTFSGPAGAAWQPGTDGVRVWVKDVNARGGIQGHPVEAVIVDDGGDPAQHLSQVKDLVENRHAFALLYNIVSTAGSDALDTYVTQKGIPTLGGDLTFKDWDKHPMYFPNGTPQDDQIYSHVFGAATLRPKLKKFGSFTCREAQGCTAARDAYPAAAKRAGLDPVYNAEVSIAQPDFTSECLGAQNAGVEILAVVVDPNSARRVAASCARQNYHPTLVFVATVVSSAQNGDPNINGTIGVISSSAYMSNSSPGQMAMRAAFKKYAPDTQLDVASTLGYSSGVMLETAAAKGLGSPLSQSRLIDNLYTFQGETLGGLAPPLTFRRGAKKSVPCFFAVEYADQAWKEANGGKTICP